jgi:nucleoside-diphosphate-sugar epimerase
MTQAWPEKIATLEELEECLSRPDERTLEALRSSEGDFLVLGAAGKMGPTLSLMLKRGLEACGLKRRLWAVSRFSEAGSADFFRRHAIETIASDLLEPGALDKLPEAANVFYLAGRKFGTHGAEHLTWAMNAHLPGLVSARFRHSRQVALSTGCVYPMVSVEGPGSREADPVLPPGEYAQSCLARERLFEYHSREKGSPVCLVRLNYAIDLRYGVLLDIAKKVHAGQTVDLSTGWVNVIWQGDANARIVQALRLCQRPPMILNVTGPDKLPVRWLAEEFGRRLGQEPKFTGAPSATAWLSDASLSFDLLGGRPSVGIDRMLDWVAHWVSAGGADLGKPTHFESREAKF